MTKDKKFIRTTMIGKRLSLTNDEVQEKSQIISDKLELYFADEAIKNVMVYSPFRNEVDISLAFEKMKTLGKNLIFPLCEDNSTMEPYFVSNLNSLIKDRYGILSPNPCKALKAQVEDIDLIIVPGVAFDKKGNRMGYGRGYYDRFLPKLRKNILKIGVAYDLQIVDEIETSTFDFPMSVVVSESRELKF